MTALPSIKSRSLSLSSKIDDLLTECNSIEVNLPSQNELICSFQNFKQNLEAIKQFENLSNYTNTSKKIESYIQYKFKPRQSPKTTISKLPKNVLSFAELADYEISKTIKGKKRKFGKCWNDLNFDNFLSNSESSSVKPKALTLQPSSIKGKNKIIHEAISGFPQRRNNYFSVLEKNTGEVLTYKEQLMREKCISNSIQRERKAQLEVDLKEFKSIKYK